MTAYRLHESTLLCTLTVFRLFVYNFNHVSYVIGVECLHMYFVIFFYKSECAIETQQLAELSVWSLGDVADSSATFPSSVKDSHSFPLTTHPENGPASPLTALRAFP